MPPETRSPTEPLIYRIDAAGRITYVNSTWTDFALKNHGEAVLPERILGCRLLDSVGGSTVRTLYKAMIKRAHAGQPVTFSYRCDAPDKRRLFAMNIRARPDGELEFASTLLWEESRVPVAFLERAQARDERMLVVCSWCEKVALPEGNWVPVEEAVTTLRLLETERMPAITHGICPACQAAMRASSGLG
jgi:hypothetical protein